MLHYPDTYYSRTLAETRERDVLTGTIKTDCAIVGGGLAGLFTALNLARGGMRVVVLEAQSVGFGASGRNGGFVSDGWAAGAATIRRHVGEAHCQALLALAEEGAEIMRRTIDELAIPGANPIAGKLRLRRHDKGDDIKALATPEMPYIDRSAIREYLVSDRYFHGRLDRQAFHIHPLNTLRGIAAEIERLGGQIFEGSAVTGHELSGQTKVLTTASGRVEAGQVVFATGGYTGPLVPRLKRAVLPIATYIMVSQPAPELLAGAIRTPMGVGDGRRAGDYYRLIEGGERLMWGGRITTMAPDTAGIVRQLRAEMLGVYPQLEPLKTDVAWSGLMAYARHLMPQIGAMAPGVWHCTAFGGHGLNTTAIGGTVLAEKMLGLSDRIALFAPFGLPWAGGPFGLATAQATYWALQVQDWWQERNAAA